MSSAPVDSEIVEAPAPHLRAAPPPESAACSPPRRLRLKLSLYYGFMTPLLCVTAVAGIAIGSTQVSWDVTLRVIGGHLLPEGWIDTHAITRADQVIVWLIRVPRVVVAALVGAGLSVAGVQMQGLFRNPLAEPGITGVGAGAVLGAVIVFVAGWTTHSVVWLPLAAFAGALLALFVVYAIATQGGVTPVSTLLLAGIALGALLSALSSLLISLSIVNWQIAQEIVFWMMGGLDSRSWTHVWLNAPFTFIGIVVALLFSRELDVLLHGEDIAASLGIEVEPLKRVIMTTAALLTGASVAVAGMVGFVGLIIPHTVRLLLGPSHRILIPASALAGAVFLILCDLAARTVHPPTEVRLGILTALCGAPFFLFLLVRRYSEVQRG
ncbi:MAG: FecCD family ABC transporter permease [Acidobacteriota bacterium]